MAAEERDPNRDPLSDESGSHFLGTGGGAADSAAAQVVNPAHEEAHWRERYTREPYYEQGRGFDDYGPAYRYGAQARGRLQEGWSAAASRLEAGWDSARGTSSLSWQQAQPAIRAAWERGGSVAGAGSTAGDRQDVLDVLEDLVECCKDGEYGFHACAEGAKREDLRAVFQQREQDCRRGASELQAQIRNRGGQASDSGSVLGAIHRGWVSVKSTLTTYDDKAILEEAERGEDNALARYRKALQKPLPPDLRDLVERQLQGVQRNHDQIKALRNQLRAAF